jgi:SAM-dependent methyltransferase
MTSSSGAEPASDPRVGSMRRYWDERARLNAPWYVDTSLSYDEPDLDRFFETGRQIVAEAIGGDVRPSGTSLAVEIGCGLGRITLALADSYERVIGVDISREMLERAREVASHERVTFVLGDGASLSQIRDGVADLVLTFTVFQHIPSVEVIERYISEAGRILKPGGLFVFQWNNTPGEGRWRLRRKVLSLGQRIGLLGERYGRNAAEFLGSRVAMPRIETALGRGGLQLERVNGERTLYAWAWARRR